VVLRGVGAVERGAFTVWVSATGIKQITFYVDGHKKKTLKHGQARNGRFKFKLSAGRLSVGAHHVSFKTVMSDPECGASRGSKLFVHPRSGVSPNFTG